jgi:hypothetical protein
VIMTVEDIRPAVGERYRHRATGRVAVLVRYGDPQRSYAERARWLHTSVKLVASDGRAWSGCPDDFWSEWIHAEAFDESVN